MAWSPGRGASLQHCKWLLCVAHHLLFFGRVCLPFISSSRLSSTWGRFCWSVAGLRGRLRSRSPPLRNCSWRDAVFSTWVLPEEIHRVRAKHRPGVPTGSQPGGTNRYFRAALIRGRWRVRKQSRHARGKQDSADGNPQQASHPHVQSGVIHSRHRQRHPKGPSMDGCLYAVPRNGM